MNNQSDADVLHSQVVLLRMQEKTTEELQSIWQENDKSKWSKEDFDAVQKILIERTGRLPEQKIAEKSTTPPELGLSEKLSRQYPYLTAFIGFIALYVLSGYAAGIIMYILSTIMYLFDVDKYQSIIVILRLILQLLFSFHGFKFVINKNLLPYIKN